MAILTSTTTSETPLDPAHRRSLAQQLAATIRRGFSTELSWSTYEQHVRSGVRAYCYETFPAVAVYHEDTISIIDGEQLVFRHDLAVPDGVSPVSIRQVDGHCVVAFHTSDYRNHHLAEHSSGRLVVCDTTQPRAPLSYSLPLPLLRFTSTGALHARSFRAGTGVVLAADPVSGAVFAADAATGELGCWDGRRYAPWYGTHQQLFTELGLAELGLELGELASDTTFQPQLSCVAPVQPSTVNSPVGAASGVHVSVVFDRGDHRHIVTNFGSFSTPHRDAYMIIARPGGGFWAAGNGTLYDAHTHHPIPSSPAFRALPGAGWHQLRPRCTTASIRLRGCTTEEASALLDAARDIKAAACAAELRGRITQVLGITDPVLVDTLVDAVSEHLN